MSLIDLIETDIQLRLLYESWSFSYRLIEEEKEELASIK